jgi:uncharacterized protein
LKIIDELLTTLPDAEVLDVRIGLRWTAVVAQVNGEKRCGLASTLTTDYNYGGQAHIDAAGQLESQSGLTLARWADHEQPTRASIGVAALNALLPRQSETWHDSNAEDVIATHGVGKTVALVGNFPFISRLESRVGKLMVIEHNPQEGQFPAEAAPDIIPQADVVAITGMTLINHTLENLLALCRPESVVLILGPSTPLSPLLFERGVNLLSGAIVTAIDPVIHAIGQGANFRQIVPLGVRLVTISSNSLD